MLVFKVPPANSRELWTSAYLDEDGQDSITTAKDATVRFGKQLIDEG